MVHVLGHEKGQGQIEGRRGQVLERLGQIARPDDVCDLGEGQGGDVQGADQTAPFGQVSGAVALAHADIEDRGPREQPGKHVQGLPDLGALMAGQKEIRLRMGARVAGIPPLAHGIGAVVRHGGLLVK